MAFFTYRGYQVFYETAGAGVPILILPDDEETHLASLELFRGLSEDYLVISFDLLGRGEADHPRGYVADIWNDQAQQIAEFLQVSEYEKVSLIGSGKGGGLTVSELIKLMPQRIDKVIVDWQAEDQVRTVQKDFAASVSVYTIDAAFYRNGKMEPTVYLHLCTQFLEGKDEKCPYCGQGMQRGYVAGDRSLPAWLIEHEDTMVFPMDTLGEFYLRDKVPKRILDKLFATEQAMNHKEGFICRNCGKIILDVKNIMT